jgi:hypothetical protein
MNLSFGGVLLKFGVPLALFAAVGSAQVTKVTGIFVVVDGEETPLESAVGTYQVKKSGLLESQVKNHLKQFLAIPGDRSTLRVKQSGTQVFLVRRDFRLPQDSGFLAVFVPGLQLLVRARLGRELVTSDITGSIIGARNHDDSPRVLVNVSRQDDSTIRVTPQLPLLPGEYAFNPGEEAVDTTPQRYAKAGAQRYTLYCFGVD